MVPLSSWLLTGKCVNFIWIQISPVPEKKVPRPGSSWHRFVLDLKMLASDPNCVLVFSRVFVMSIGHREGSQKVQKQVVFSLIWDLAILKSDWPLGQTGSSIWSSSHKGLDNLLWPSLGMGMVIYRGQLRIILAHFSCDRLCQSCSPHHWDHAHVVFMLPEAIWIFVTFVDTSTNLTRVISPKTSHLRHLCNQVSSKRDSNTKRYRTLRTFDWYRFHHNPAPKSQTCLIACFCP